VEAFIKGRESGGAVKRVRLLAQSSRPIEPLAIITRPRLLGRCSIDSLSSRPSSSPSLVCPVDNPGQMVSLTCVPEFAVTGNDDGQRLTLNLRVCAPELAPEDESKRATVSLTAVLDTSGSMAGSKLALVKRTCQFVLGQLGPQDRLGVVEYDSEVNELVPLSKTSELFKQQAAKAIDSMNSGSCTNLSGGLLQGIMQQKTNTYVEWEELASAGNDDDASSWVMVDEASSSLSSVSSLANHMGDARLDVSSVVGASNSTTGNLPRPRRRREADSAGGSMVSKKDHRIFGGVAPPTSRPVEVDAVRSVFLFTDGQANVGLSDDALVTATKNLLDSQPLIKVFTFGFGSDHSDKLLTDLAEAGGGLYYYIEKEDQIATAFADALGGLLSVAVQNLKLDLVPSEGVVIEQLNTPFKTTETAAGGCQVTIGDLLSEESKDLLVEVRLPPLNDDDSGIDPLTFKMGTLKASFFDVGTSSLESCHIDLIVKRSKHVPVDLEPNLQVSLQRARIETAAALAEGSQLADAGNFEGARLVLELKLKQVASLVSTAKHKDNAIVAAIAQVLVADLEEAINSTRDVDIYRSMGSKAMKMKGATRKAQVCDFRSPVKSAGSTRGGAVDSEEEEDEEVMRFKSGSKRQRNAKLASPAFRSL
jgi:Mg-chelatase subunit ChlD